MHWDLQRTSFSLFSGAWCLRLLSSWARDIGCSCCKALLGQAKAWKQGIKRLLLVFSSKKHVLLAGSLQSSQLDEHNQIVCSKLKSMWLIDRSRISFLSRDCCKVVCSAVLFRQTELFSAARQKLLGCSNLTWDTVDVQCLSFLLSDVVSGQLFLVQECKFDPVGSKTAGETVRCTSRGVQVQQSAIMLKGSVVLLSCWVGHKLCTWTSLS